MSNGESTRRRGICGGVEGDRAHVDGGARPRRRAGSEGRARPARRPPPVSTMSVPSRAQALAGRDPRERAHAVAAHLGVAAVGVVEQHLGVGAVGAGLDHDQPVGADAAVAVAERGRLRGVDRGTPACVVQPRPHEEVVAGGVQLGQPDGRSCAPACQQGGERPSTDSRAPRTSGCGDRAGTTCAGDGRTAGCARPTASNASSSAGSHRRGGLEHLAVADGLRGGARQRSLALRRPRTSSTRPGLAHRVDPARRCASFSTGPRAATRRRCGTGNTGGPNAWRPGAERRERAPGDLDAPRAPARSGGRCRARCAPRPPGRGALQLGVGGGEALGRRGTGEHRVADRPVLRREA